MRVCHIITGLATGGAERMLVRLLSTGPKDHIVFSLRRDGPQGDALRALGVAVVCVGLNPWRLFRSVCGQQPTLVVGWMYHGNLAATLAGWVCRVPVVWNVRHSVTDFRQEKPALRWAIRVGALLSRSPRAIVYNSRVAASQHGALGYSTEHVLVLPNGVDTAVFAPSASARPALCDELGLPTGSFLVGNVARYHPMKNHTGFLRAAALVLADVPSAHFIMVGPGVDKNNANLVALVGQLGLVGKVHLLGERPDIHSLLAGLDVFVLSSSWGEGFPNVVVEAMACGVPVVTTDVGDAGAVVGQTGRVVTPADAQLLARAVLSLHALGGPGLQVLGKAARQRVLEVFDIGAVARLYKATWVVD
jgi:glycosyltransferase involved in cell wall biosynthesis